MAAPEGFVFAGTDWNDFTNFRIQGFDPGIAPKRWQWISGSDSDGALSPDEADYDNAEMTVRVRIMPQASMDAALAKIGTLVSALQECEKQPLGSAAVWTPNGSTKPMTMYILGGEVTGLPITLTGDDAGWFLKNPSPVVVMKLYRRPFLYAAEVTNAATVTTDTNPIQTFTIASVPGDVAADARLVFIDAATQVRRHIEVGVENRYYNASTSLLLDSASLDLTGFAGTATTRTGAFSASGVVRATMTTRPVAICGTGNQVHIGDFRIKARIFAGGTQAGADGMLVRLSWRDGEGEFHANEWAALPGRANQWYELDLGMITIRPTLLGTQRWSGKIEAYSPTITDTAVTTDIDFIVVEPAEVYLRARASPVLEAPSSWTAVDNFNQTAGVLGGKTAEIGGAWTTVGTVGGSDLTVDATNHNVIRTTSAADASNLGRGATLPQTMTNTNVSVAVAVDSSTSLVSVPQVMARYTNESNLIRAYMQYLGNTFINVVLEIIVAGVATTLGVKSYNIAVDPSQGRGLQLIVDSGGAAFVWLDGTTLIISSGHAALATGGALASGLPGFRDAMMTGGGGTGTRHYDAFSAASFTPYYVVNSGRATEIRSDGVYRQDSTGTYYGSVPFRGARFYLPNAGSANRTSRVMVKGRRNDIEVQPDDAIADSTTLALHYTPRYLVAPR